MIKKLNACANQRIYFVKNKSILLTILAFDLYYVVLKKTA
jgi:hypothetical protein